MPGCVPRLSRIEILDHREADGVQSYRETFDEAYYCLNGAGDVEIVLRRTLPSTETTGPDVTQVVHVRTVWKSIPGSTVAERTQINGTVSYAIVYGRTGAAFEGAGSVFCKQNRQKDVLRGTLEQAVLKPTRRLGEGSDLFHRAELAGEFRAVHNPRRVRRIVNEMNLLLGPLPKYVPGDLGPR